MGSVPVNYIEFKSNDLAKTKTFYTTCFGWSFTDYGPTYTAFSKSESGIDGGFEHSDEPIHNGALIVLLEPDLDMIKQKILDAGGRISVDTFSFPGGSRFQFLDPSGNELSVWRIEEE